MDLSESLRRLDRSEALGGSIVSFLPGLIADYLSGGIPREAYCERFLHEMGRQKLYFVQFPQELIEENQRVFKREFAFADTMDRLVRTGAGKNDEDFRQAVIDCVQTYLRSAG